MHTFDELILKHKGKVICVMGGAPSLGDDLQDIKADVYISANEHGTAFREVDYMVAIDDACGRNGLPIAKHLREFSDAPIIGQHEDVDFRLHAWPGSPRKTYSGMVAVWCAWAMGAKAVVLAGVNAYEGKDSAMRDARLVADAVRCPVRVAGSNEENKLLAVWPAYDASEKFGRYTPHPSIEGLRGTDNRVQVEVIKPTEIGGRPVKRGDKLTGMRHELARLIKHGMVREI